MFVSSFTAFKDHSSSLSTLSSVLWKTKNKKNPNNKKTSFQAIRTINIVKIQLQKKLICLTSHYTVAFVIVPKLTLKIINSAGI